MEIFKQFGIQPTLLVAQIINFGIILFVLKKFFYKPITKMLDARRATIEQSLKNADEIETKLQQTEEKSAKIIAGSQQKAEQLLEDAKKQADTVTNNAMDETKKATEDMMQKAMEQIAAEKEKMKKEVEEETLALVVEVTQKVLGRTMKTSEKAELTKKAITQMSGKVS
jgi:F-type H+-transporting ATPase subunit b